MTREGFARLAYEALYDAQHGEGGWEAWAADEQAVRDLWLKVGLLIESMIEDARPSERKPEPAKVIVVTERDRLGRVTRELRYDANQAEVSEYGILRVLRKGSVIGEHQGPGGFSWREEGAIAYDGPADKRKLAIALAALKRLAEQDYNPDNPGEQTFEIAEDALVSIADVDL